jgi:plasmid maintenance system antidote protein VapI
MKSGRERLRAWIERSKVNQTEAAVILSMNAVHLSQILNGQRGPGLATAVNIERVTGISVESWLLTSVSDDEDDEKPSAGKRQIAKR